MDRTLDQIERSTSGTSGDGSGELHDRRDQAGHQGGRLRRVPALEYVYWQVYHANGIHYCQCTSEKDAWAITTMESHRGSFYQRKVIKMKPTIDVESENLGYEDRIRGQQGLPQSDWTVL